jgi:exo-beta-1,3-glucanase (GH17 family)
MFFTHQHPKVMGFSTLTFQRLLTCVKKNDVSVFMFVQYQDYWKVGGFGV